MKAYREFIDSISDGAAAALILVGYAFFLTGPRFAIPPDPESTAAGAITMGVVAATVMGLGVLAHLIGMLAITRRLSWLHTIAAMIAWLALFGAFLPIVALRTLY